MKKCGLYIEGLGAERAIEKLVSAGIPVLEAEKPQKNAVVVWVDGKDCKKGFAILNHSCYNIKKVRYRGLLRFARLALRSGGLIVGAAVFLSAVCFFESRVLRIEVTGSGAYYADTVKSILTRNGTTFFSPSPKETGELCAEIMSLPRVTFCSLKTDGGILIVDVEVGDEALPLESVALVAPQSGRVVSLVSVRGTPLVKVGDEVSAGDVLVANYTLTEAGAREVTVIASASISHFVSCEYELPVREAAAQAYLDYGELEGFTATPTETGTLVEGTAQIVLSKNMI